MKHRCNSNPSTTCSFVLLKAKPQLFWPVVLVWCCDQWAWAARTLSKSSWGTGSPLLCWGEILAVCTNVFHLSCTIPITHAWHMDNINQPKSSTSRCQSDVIQTSITTKLNKAFDSNDRDKTWQKHWPQMFCYFLPSCLEIAKTKRKQAKSSQGSPNINWEHLNDILPLKCTKFLLWCNYQMNHSPTSPQKSNESLTFKST